MRKVCNLEIYENMDHDIVINDNTEQHAGVVFDECMAEKLCRLIMEVATEIREQK